MRSALGKLAWVREGRATGIKAVTFGAAAGLSGEAEAGPEPRPEPRAATKPAAEAEPAARARQPTLLLVVSPGGPRWIAEGREGFVAWEHEGIYRARGPLLGEGVSVHLRGLALALGNSVLRLLGCACWRRRAQTRRRWRASPSGNRWQPRSDRAIIPPPRRGPT